MNNTFRRSATFLFSYFPHVLVALMLVSFTYHSVLYEYWVLDDFAFQDELKRSGIIDTSLLFYKSANGRLASHFFLSSVIKLFTSFDQLFIYRLVMLFAFIISLSHLLKNYLKAFRKKTISSSRSLFYSAFITSFLFFFYFSGKFELWFWVSSTGVYLISLIIAMNGFALILSDKQTPAGITLATLLFFLAGGFSESYAIMYFLVLIYFSCKITRNDPFFTNRKHIIVPAFIAISAGLLINAFSGGAHNRLDQLNDFGFLYPFKNTLHSLAFPVLRYRYLWIEILITAIFLAYAYFLFPAHFNWKHFAKKAAVVLLFITLSFFIPCFILSDIVPDRAASLGYLAGVLFLFDYFIFRTNSFGK